MRNLIILLIGLLSITSGYGQVVSKIDEVNWLLGTWTRTNSKPGRSSFEIWQKNSANSLTGKGISMNGVDTTFVEKLQIIVKDNTLYYVADVPENNALVYFKFTSLKNNGFVCENPDHDFPKKIEYTLHNGNQLKAVVSGDGKEIVYLFTK